MVTYGHLTGFFANFTLLHVCLYFICKLENSCYVAIVRKVFVEKANYRFGVKLKFEFPSHYCPDCEERSFCSETQNDEDSHRLTQILIVADMLMHRMIA
jgi:hypothetical protein